MLAHGDGLLADLPCGHLKVLLADGVDDIRGVEVQCRHLGGVEPSSQAVIALPEIRNPRDAGQPSQLILDVNGRVVAEKRAVIATVRRDQIDDHHGVRGHLLDADALELDQLGDDRKCQRDAVLDEHLSHVGVHAQPKGHGQYVGAVIGALRRHVHHVLHAADLLLDRRRDGVPHRHRVGPGIDGRDQHRGRRHLGVLRHRQCEHRHSARQHDDE